LCSVLTHRRTPVTSPLSLHDALPIYISDTHLTPGRKRLLAWLRSLDDLDPHLVINTGDSISHPQAIRPFLDALGPLLDRPGAFRSEEPTSELHPLTNPPTPLLPPPTP